jgi:glutamate-1-semialdehyde 2,1-aminomutase
MRDWATRNGSMLVLDEVITFRAGYGGLQERYGVTPDLTALGKMIGGGFPVGAVAGRADVMDVMNPHAERLLFPHSGTFSANPITTCAGLAAMEKFDRAAVARLNALADHAIAGINDAIRATGIGACVTGAGSMFRVHMKAQPPASFRDAYPTPEETRRLKMMLEHLFDEGFLLINSGSSTLSTPMTESDVDSLVNGMASAFEKIVAEG